MLVNFDERLTWYPSETNDCELQLNYSSTGIKTVYVLLYGTLFEMEEFNVSWRAIKAQRMNFIAGNYKLGGSQYCILANKGKHHWIAIVLTDINCGRWLKRKNKTVYLPNCVHT